MTTGSFEGVLAPVLTPFKADLSPDTERFVAFCHWLVDQGIDGLAAFGTTSEANSQSIEERMALLEAAIEGGVPAAKFMPGTGCCALTDSVRATEHAVKLGCGGVLMLPPFYYKGMTDEGLHSAFSEVIQRVGDDRLKIYLYHIPPQAQVDISLELIEMLVKDYPDTVVGLKDSSGDWSNTQAVIDAFPGFDVFPGSEVFLLDGLRAGGVGCITATGNANPAGIRKVFENWEGDQADDLQAAITATRKIIQARPMVPALKAILAHYHDDPSWATVRPPMVTLDAEARAGLIANLEADGFTIAPRRLEDAAE
ncbi:MAG: dihydrodipicolinate synthase family protein [Alphaproteobacteria bacterium]|nr:dihydrodipicolinate synthase family protein [Alphaproteobacteria bacterium]